VPYSRPETADVFLRAARAVVLPYRHHDGSSGIMLQAAAAGRPVLVPDRGLMAWRTRRFGLGETFADGDLAGMRRGFRSLLEVAQSGAGSSGVAYGRCFSPRDVHASLRLAVTGKGPGAPLPQDHLPLVSESPAVTSPGVRE